MLYDKWWKGDPVNNQMAHSGMNGGQLGGEEQKCKKRRSSADNMANALGVVNIGGIFVVLLCGLIVGYMPLPPQWNNFVATAQFCRAAWQLAS